MEPKHHEVETALNGIREYCNGLYDVDPDCQINVEYRVDEPGEAIVVIRVFSPNFEVLPDPEED